MKKILLSSLILVSLTSCSQFALVASGGSLVISQNSFAKIYNSIDVLTIMSTEKNIKGHIYERIKKPRRSDQTINEPK